LGPQRHVERVAVLEALDRLGDQDLHEPWRSAWRLIDESWRDAVDSRRDTYAVYQISKRIQKGERSGALISRIVDVVRPVLEVKPRSDWNLSVRKRTRRPRSAYELMSVGLTSGDLVNPAKAGLDAVRDRWFLVELAHELNAAVTKALDIGHRLGWDDNHWHLASVRRVYFVCEADRPPNEYEPDELHQGLAPAVKLLYAAVSRLVEVDPELGRVFGTRWQTACGQVFLRMWAALARDERLASASEVAAFLLGCDNRPFWDVRVYPEISELRARRFADLTQGDQRALLSRLRRKPPRRYWPKGADGDRVEQERIRWVTRELRRIEVAGTKLPSRQHQWLAARLEQFSDLGKMSRADEGFPGTPKAQAVPANPDERFDPLSGTRRLDALEQALNTERLGWDNDPAGRAADWMRQPGRADSVLADLEADPNAGEAYPTVWDQFGRAHATTGDGASRNVTETASRVVDLLGRLPERTAREAIDGITAWLLSWVESITDLPSLTGVWMRLWQIAVEVTNARQPEDPRPSLDVVPPSYEDREPMGLDTLNNPVGRLVGVFLAKCPSVEAGDRPFANDDSLRAMRDVAAETSGRSGLIARHRMVEAIRRFRVADPEWVVDHLLQPLQEDTTEALALWRAVARQTHFREMLEIVGEQMAERAIDLRLDRETRKSLVWSVTLEVLHAFREDRAPVIPVARIQQMLRSVDDEVRARGAETVQRFVSDLSAGGDRQPNSQTPESLFANAARPFLNQVWPHERSYATPGVAHAFANLPAVCGEAFAEAVDVIERFLVPFECWSMLDYGLYGDEEGRAKLSKIDTRQKAEALLRLLDRTIGTAEGSIVPIDLGSALEQVRTVAPQLVETQRFRRLTTLTRL
jgi:hypothetical protein